MPIKLPKGFQRRKSSGNALEELPNPPETSFRVFERPEGAKSFDGGDSFERISRGRPMSAGHLTEDHLYVGNRPNTSLPNRGSGGTNNSASSGGNNDNSSSSARFSSSSTLPSSTDLTLDDKSTFMQREMFSKPVPPIPESNPLSLRAAGRAFSFGRKKVGSPVVATPSPRPDLEYLPVDGYSGFNRQRAMTESSYASESTARPPKLLDTSLDLGQSDLDGFGSMFESFGKRRSNLVEEPQALSSLSMKSPENNTPGSPNMPVKSHFEESSTYTRSPMQVDRSRPAKVSPGTLTTFDSRDSLVASEPTTAKNPNYYGSNPSEPGFGQGLSTTRTIPNVDSTSPLHGKRQQGSPSLPGQALQRSSVYTKRRDSHGASALAQDEDAKLVMDSLSAGQKFDRQSAASDSDDEADNPSALLVPQSSYPASYDASGQKIGGLEFRQRPSGPLFDSSDRDFSATSWQQSSSDTTPRAKKRELVQEEERSLFDTTPPPTGRPAPSKCSAVDLPVKPKVQNKVMTPAQFERYRKEQEIVRDQYFRHDGSDDEGDEYEDDDEMERTKLLARQRRKQEAHLAVYRQQMMKVTGEQPADLPNEQARPVLDRTSISIPYLADRSVTPSFTLDRPAGTNKASDDEDEDVPLGVLAAHGFPSKGRPPIALGTSSSKIQYKSESYPPPPGSTAGISASGARSLPPFAKNLPPDPYYGAGLVNASNREPLAFGHGAPGSAHGAAQPPLMPPGGLVGVIAGEERARAARRGSPKSQGQYGSPLPQVMTQAPMAMAPGMPLSMSPGEQATIHMSEQMGQMMQMQMQWMQQMQQMMVGGVSGLQPGQQPPSTVLPQQQQSQQQMTVNSGMLVTPGQLQRPMSTGSHSIPGPSAGSQLAQQRSMSMMSPVSTPQWQIYGTNQTLAAPNVMSAALGGPRTGSTPSIAPSERSNVGMPSRYRPVSVSPADEYAPRTGSRSSTFTSGTLQPGGPGRSSKLSATDDKHTHLSVRQMSQTLSKKNSRSEDDDEEGWQEMKKKRDLRRLNKRKDEKAALDVYDYPHA